MIPGDLAALRSGVDAYHTEDSRDDTYVVTRRHIESFWPDHESVADAVAVLVRVWNGANRGVGPSSRRLAEVIRDRRALIELFRQTDILDLGKRERTYAGKLLEDLMPPAGVFKRQSGNWNTSRVGAAKALHMLAPSCLPAWDEEIAKGCGHLTGQHGDDYSGFILDCQDWMSDNLKDRLARAREAQRLNIKYHQSKTLLRRLDEYLFVTFR